MTTFTNILKAALVASTALAPAAQACSRLAKTSDHGVAYVRSVDWGQKTGMMLQTIGAGDDATTYDAPGYAQQFDAPAKHFAMTWVEQDVFHGVQAQAWNEAGMVVDTLYMNDSQAFSADYSDTGAPAINMADLPGVIASQYDTAPAIAAAYDAGEFQIAWGAETGDAGQHGLHFSAVDVNGDVVLFQLNDGGEVKVYTGNIADSDLGVKANAPLLQEHRANIAAFNAADGQFGTDIRSDISSPGRHLRLSWLNANSSLAGMSKAEAVGAVSQMYDTAASVPQQIIDPTNDETYATWQTTRALLGDDVVTIKDHGTTAQVKVSISAAKAAHKAAGGSVCADAMAQANSGQHWIAFDACQ